MEAERTLGAEELTELGELAAQLRVDAIRCSTKAGSGHPTSSLSAADLLAVLISRHLRYQWTDPHCRANDHLIFSKGHASPLLYAVFKAAGAITDQELIETYRQFGSRLQGHPTPVLPWVDVATGSLGQGLPVGVGIALAAGTSTTCRSTCGRCAGTARWPRVPSGRRWTRPATTGCAT
ncbi:hypothetical protein [Micromonospora sp. ATA51]|uniref:hypothetical protein n=1 Tax=Micromonospora sp. ATA51 TaxID=2806098 RepID=UPI002101F962|nr:hypothetical protein [Micromonospora sp. ATA51]